MGPRGLLIAGPDSCLLAKASRASIKNQIIYGKIPDSSSLFSRRKGCVDSSTHVSFKQKRSWTIRDLASQQSLSRRISPPTLELHAKSKFRDNGRPLGVRAASTDLASADPGSAPSTSQTKSALKKRVLVIGGSGRVGESTARALLLPDTLNSGLELEVSIAGRNLEKGKQSVSALGPNIDFVPCDIDNDASLVAAVEGADIVIHTAGPFQRKPRCSVLEACIKAKVPRYMDVCDDSAYAKNARSLHEQAREAGLAALTTTGIYPGVSNVIAAELVRLSRKDPLLANDDDDDDVDDQTSPSPSNERLSFSYFTAGSGGAGPTILSTSYLLLGEEVVAYLNGKEFRAKPYSGRKSVDFGKGVGRRSTYLLNLPEVATAFETLRIPTVSARFGTAPEFWNWAMEAMVALLPKDFLEDPSRVQGLVTLSDPLVRAVDRLVGETMAIRVDLDCSDGKKAVGLLSHKSLSTCVGTATCAFARAMLEDSTEPGVWYPEEEGGLRVDARTRLLERASVGALNYALNRPPWMVESPALRLGFGLYWE